MSSSPNPGRASGSEANSLGLSLGFVEGAAFVALRDKTLFDGLVLRALELELAEVEFPLDLRGGAEEFQRRSTRVRSLVVDVDLDLALRRLEHALALAKSPLGRLAVRLEGGRLRLEAQLGEGLPSGAWLADLLVAPAEPLELRLHVGAASVFGEVPRALSSLPGQLLAAVELVLEKLGEKARQSARRLGARTLALEPLQALFWTLFPAHGWKVPGYEELVLARIERLAPSTLRLVYGAPPATVTIEPETPPQEWRGDEEAVLAALALDGQATAGGEASPSAGLEALRETLTARAVDAERLARALEASLGAEGQDELLGAVATLALGHDPRSVPALLARAALAARAGQPAEAVSLYEQASRILREQGERRAAGLACLAAARASGAADQPPSERARLVEDAVALRADDPVALAALVEVLPQVGRASAALRAARRLATVAPDAESRISASISAAELLRGPLADPAQARRELERALRLVPEHPRASEALVEVLIAVQDPIAAGRLLERQLAGAERAEDAVRASRLAVRLGVLVAAQRPDEALARFQRAHALAPDRLAPLARWVELAERVKRDDLRAAALERAAPRLASPPSPEERPDALVLHLARARSLDAARADQEVEACLRAALELDPGCEEALVGLARQRELSGDRAGRAEVLAQRARLALESSAPGEAGRLLAEEVTLVAAQPESLASVRARLHVALAAHHAERSLLDALLAAAEASGDPAWLADALERRRVLAEPPAEQASLYDRLGRAFESAGRTLEAAHAYEEALSLEPASSHALTALLALQRARGDRDRLVAVLARAESVESELGARGRLVEERARLLIAMGRDDEALQALSEVLTIADRGPAALEPGLRRAMEAEAMTVALRIGRLDDAERWGRGRLAAIADEDPAVRLPALLQLAKLAEALGDHEGLIEHLEAAQELLEPGSEEGRSVALRLARELAGTDRLPQLAALQRRLARSAGTPPLERAERLLAAARLAARLGDEAQAELDAEEALTLVEDRPRERTIRLAALELLEGLAARAEDPVRLAGLFARRAALAEEQEAKEALWLEAASTLVGAGLRADALVTLQRASQDASASTVILDRLGALARETGAASVASDALGRAAAIAREAQEPERARRLFAEAAAVLVESGDSLAALDFDRQVFELTDASAPLAEVGAPLARLEAHARANADVATLVELLGRRASLVPSTAAALLLLEKAQLEGQRLGREREALETLRQARERAVSGPRAEAIDDALSTALHEAGLFAEGAALLVERAEREADPRAKAKLLFRAATLHARELDDRGMALARVQAVLRIEPAHAEARTLRLALLQELGPSEALAEALEEEAPFAGDPEASSLLLLEAAALRAPLDGQDERPLAARELEEALALVQRARAALPDAVEPLRAEAAYTRALGMVSAELESLGRLAALEAEPELRAGAELRRAELSSDEPLVAVAALEAALDHLAALPPEASAFASARLLETLGPSSLASFGLTGAEDLPALERALLAALASSAEAAQDWPGLIRALGRWVEVEQEPSQRAELRIRAGQLWERRMHDALAAESEYGAALALVPDHRGAKEALRRSCLERDGFDALADGLGVEALQEAWTALEPTASPERRAALGAALWPRLEAGSPARSALLLALADLVGSESRGRDEALPLLERVVAEGGPGEVGAALERLRMLHLEAERHEAYCEVLRRQADQATDDRARARAIAELGEALEWKLGDGAGAEREYRAALAVDRGCAEAASRLAELLASQDRFEQVLIDLGPSALEQVFDGLVERGPKEAERALVAAEHLASALEDAERGRFWLRVATRAAALGDEGAALERTALRSAADVEGPARAEALALLTARLENAGERGELVEVLRRRLELAPDDARRLALHLDLARLLLAEAASSEEPAVGARHAAEAERSLRQVVSLDAQHPEARHLLMRLLTDGERLVELGTLFGTEAIEDVRRRASTDGHPHLASAALVALAQLTRGEERAGHLVSLALAAAAAQPDVPASIGDPESLFRAALESAPRHSLARAGLRELLTAAGRYRDLGLALGPEVLRETLGELEARGEEGARLPATLALAQLLAKDASAARERAELLADAALLQLAEEDDEAAEVSLREAFALDASNARVRERLRSLLVQEGRAGELGALDVALLEEAVDEGRARGDAAPLAPLLRALSELRVGSARAELLFELHTQLADVAEAEAALEEALQADGAHAPSRAALTELLWSSGRHAEALASAGPEAFARRVEGVAATDAATALDAFAAVQAELPTTERARLLEVLAGVDDLRLDPAEDGARRLGALAEARSIWDALGDREGQARVRMDIADLCRTREDMEPLLAALQDALEYVEEPDLRAALAVERAALLLEDPEHGEEARSLLATSTADEAAPLAPRLQAARLLIDRDLEPGSSELRLTALTLLTAQAASLRGGPLPELDAAVRAQDLVALADLLDERGEDPARVAEPLEAALRLVADREGALRLRRRLKDLYDQLGDWARMAEHVALLAEAEGSAELWVSLAELRVWLDDRDAARIALERALEQAPAYAPAHEALLRLSEHGGDSHLSSVRLEAWAEVDRDGAEDLRAERLLRAARLAAQLSDSARAELLAERALGLLSRQHPATERLAREALLLLAPLGAEETRLSILTRVVSEADRRSLPELRLELARLLVTLGRRREAATVLEQGLHRELSEDSPLLAQLLLEARESAEGGARRLLALADHLGSGPAARRLRIVAAELAEAAGEHLTARTAWSTLRDDLGDPSGPPRARAAILRLSRTLDDPRALVSALEDAAEDAPSGSARAALLAEAAALADERLDDPERAERLLRRAFLEAPDDAGLEERHLELLGRLGRWQELELRLGERLADSQGEERLALTVRLAELRAGPLGDPGGAADLLLDAHRRSDDPALGAQAVHALRASGRGVEAAALFAVLGADARTRTDAPPRSSEDGEPRAAPIVDEVEPPSQGQAAAIAAPPSPAKTVEQPAPDVMPAAPPTPSAPVDDAGAAGSGTKQREQVELLLARGSDAGRAAVEGPLLASRILLEELQDRRAAAEALAQALAVAERLAAEHPAEAAEWLGPPPVAEDVPLSEARFDSPLIELAHAALALERPVEAVTALGLLERLFAERPEGRRARLLLAAAEAEALPAEAADERLRAVVEEIRGSSDALHGERLLAERALGSRLLARGAPGAAEALGQAERLLATSLTGSSRERAQLLLQLAAAHRAEGRAGEAARAILDAHALAPDQVAEELLISAVAEAGPSPAAAQALQRRGWTSKSSSHGAACLEQAAEQWRALGEPERALHAELEAHALEPTRERARRLEERMRAEERWDELDALFATRIAASSPDAAETAELLVARARILADRLGRPRQALEGLRAAAASGSGSLELLETLAALARQIGEPAVEAEALAALVAVAGHGPRGSRALARRARVLDALGDDDGVIACLEELLERSIGAGRPAGSTPEHLANVYRRRGALAEEARLWVRVAMASDGPAASLALARAATLRADSGDKRGAVVAWQAAAQRAPLDVGLQRAAMNAAVAMGDLARARQRANHAAEAAEQAGLSEARRLYCLEEARLAAGLGDVARELELWAIVLRDESSTPAVLEELVARARTSLSAEAVESLLAGEVTAHSPGPWRGMLRLARARLLAEPLSRHLEAEVERAFAASEDFLDGVLPSGLAVDAVAREPETIDLDERYRAKRTALDRAGRWEALATLEEERSSRLANPVARADSLTEVGRLHLSARSPEHRESARIAFTRAVEACPDHVEALTLLAGLDVDDERWEEALGPLHRLMELGGTSWTPPTLELRLAEAFRLAGDHESELGALAAAQARAPGVPQVLVALAEAHLRREDREAAARTLDALAEALDPELDAQVIGKLLLRMARQAVESGDQVQAQAHLERLLAIEPASREGHALRIELLESSGEPETLLQALEEAARLGVEGHGAQLERALEVAVREGWSGAAYRCRRALQREPWLPHGLAERLVQEARSDHDAVGLSVLIGAGWVTPASLTPGELGAVAATVLARGDVTQAVTLLAAALPSSLLAGAEAHEEVQPSSSVLVAIEAVRNRGELVAFAAAVSAALLGPAAPEIAERSDPFGTAALAAPRLRGALRTLLERLPTPEVDGPVLRFLASLWALAPSEPSFGDRLIEALHATGADGALEARVLRHRLRAGGLERSLVERLSIALPAEHSAGPVAVAAFLERKESSLPLGLAPEQLRLPECLEVLAHPDCMTPLADALRITASALGQLASGPGEEAALLPIEEDQRAASALVEVRAVTAAPFRALVEPRGGVEVRWAASTPPRLIVGARLIEEASPAELRFHLAEALFTLELGGVITCLAPAEQLRVLRLLRSLGDPARALPPEDREPLQRLESALEPRRRGEVALALALLGDVGLTELESWRRALEITARRAALLAAGELGAAVSALGRTEPRLQAASLDSEEARREALTRWSSLADLTELLLSEGYARLLTVASAHAD
jgi:hypothetical protein